MPKTLEVIPIDKIKPAPDNPRRELGDLSELAANIKELGILQTPTVARRDDGYFLMVMGHRRMAAAKLAGLAELECWVKDYASDDDRVIEMLAENIRREDLTPLEEARSFQMLTDLGWSQRKVADHLGSKQGHVTKRLSLLALPEKVQRLVDKGARAVAAEKPDHDDALNITEAQELAKVAHIEGGIDFVLEHRHWHGGIAGAVRRALADHEQAQKRAKVVTGLEARGIKVVPFAHGYYGDRASIRRLDDYGFAVDARSHAKLECHAVAVDNYGHEVKVCTSPKTHSGKAQKKTPAQLKAEADARERTQQLADAAEARAEVMRATLSRRALPKGAMELVCTQALHFTHYGEERVIAAGLLGIAATKGVSGSNRAWDAGNKLATLVEKQPSMASKVALALAFGVAEHQLKNHPFLLQEPEVVAHYAFLESLGYQRRPIEKQREAKS